MNFTEAVERAFKGELIRRKSWFVSTDGKMGLSVVEQERYNHVDDVQLMYVDIYGVIIAIYHFGLYIMELGDFKATDWVVYKSAKEGDVVEKWQKDNYE